MTKYFEAHVCNFVEVQDQTRDWLEVRGNSETSVAFVMCDEIVTSYELHRFL